MRLRVGLCAFFSVTPSCCLSWFTSFGWTSTCVAYASVMTVVPSRWKMNGREHRLFDNKRGAQAQTARGPLAPPQQPPRGQPLLNKPKQG